METGKTYIKTPSICLFTDYLPQNEWKQIINYIETLTPSEFAYPESGDSKTRFKKVKHSRFPEIEYEKSFVLDDEDYELIMSGQKSEPYPESLGNDYDWKVLRHKPSKDEVAEALIKTIYKSQQIILDFFNDKTIWEYGPFLSLFGEGKLLRLHCDDFQYGIQGHPQTDYSTIYYVNDDYEGGEIYLPALGLNIKPRANSLLLWSNSWHEDMAHGVKSVISGNRYVSQGFFTTC